MRALRGLQAQDAWRDFTSDRRAHGDCPPPNLSPGAARDGGEARAAPCLPRRS